MRVISGIYRSRKLEGYDLKTTRPSIDRVKESMFACINYYIGQSICLDLFAGSGSLGIEAISNGAKYCYFNDNTLSAIKVLENNITALKIEDFSIFKLDYMEALRKINSLNLKLDIIFIDAPYIMNIIDNVCDYIFDNNLLSKDGIIVYEHNNYQLSNDNYYVWKEKKFKDIFITMYKQKIN